MKARGSSSVMAVRRSPPKALDYFPTPPWATRAGAELIREVDLMATHPSCAGIIISEPACGGGHMARVLEDEFGDTSVDASDVFDYGWGHSVRDFLSTDWHSDWGSAPDWIVTNPPFNIAATFALLALGRARRGVALLLRSSFAEGGARYRQLFAPHPPEIEAIFCDRVPMVAGRWNPKASTATAYSWFIWTKPSKANRLLLSSKGCTQRRWIAPGTRDRLWMPDDVRRFAPEAPAPLLDGI